MRNQPNTQGTENYDYEGLICVGCAMMAANGENIGDGGDGIEPLARVEGYHVAVCEEWGFATSPCDGCGSRLGGYRFVASFLSGS